MTFRRADNKRSCRSRRPPPTAALVVGKLECPRLRPHVLVYSLAVGVVASPQRLMPLTPPRMAVSERVSQRRWLQCAPTLDLVMPADAFTEWQHPASSSEDLRHGRRAAHSSQGKRTLCIELAWK